MAWETKHGMSRSLEYQSWENMVQRCTNPKAPNYARYGGAGVVIEPRFMDFAEFYKEVGARPEGTSLDRVDTKHGYVAGNIRWVNASGQELNKLLPQPYPGTTLDKRRGTWSWRYTRDGVTYRKSGMATQVGAFVDKVLTMKGRGIPLSRSDTAAFKAVQLNNHIH